MCCVATPPVCYWIAGNAHTLLSQHNTTQGPIKWKISLLLDFFCHLRIIFWGMLNEHLSSVSLVNVGFYSSGSEMSWPGSSRPGSSLSLHHQSWCPKPGIIGSDSTWEDATTARADPSTGILLWNCTKRACVWILEHSLRLWLFFFSRIVLVICRVVLSASMSMCDGGSGVWRLKCGRVPTK